MSLSNIILGQARTTSREVSEGEPKNNNDDLTRPTTNDGEDDKGTQPTITAVFRLLREVKQDVENTRVRVENIGAGVENISARLDTTNTRLDEIELRLAGDVEGLNTRMVEGFRNISHKLDALSRSRLQTEADYIGLLQRVTELESKTP